MATRTKTNYIDVDRQLLLSSNTSTVATEAGISNLFLYNTYNLRLQAVSNASGYDLSDCEEFVAYYGNLGDSPLANVASTGTNLDTDWLDLADGRISVQLTLNSNVASDISTSTYKKQYLQVIARDTVLAENKTIAVVPYNTRNVMVTPSSVVIDESSSSSSSVDSSSSSSQSSESSSSSSSTSESSESSSSSSSTSESSESSSSSSGI